MIDRPTFEMPVHALAAEIASRRLSPVDLVDETLQRIATHDPRLHAFVTVYADGARLAAEAADKAIRADHAVGPLHGIPIALKDVIELEGRVVTGGAPVWRDRMATRTATVAKRLVAAGMIVVGKTHTVEFAFGGWGTNQHMGTPLNPWDLVTPRAPGGSSSGSGVAVAARLVPCAIGTDTGGSIRVPASYCGITGLKTTVGRLSGYGVLPFSRTLDSVGPMARSVEDVALLFQVMHGPDPEDPKTLGLATCDPLRLLKRGVARTQLARLKAAECAGLAHEVRAAYEASLEILARLGAEIVDFDLPAPLVEINALNGRIMSAEGYAELGHLVDDPTLTIDSDVRPRLTAGAGVLARDYLADLTLRETLKRAFNTSLADADALLTPTTETPAPTVASIDQRGTPAVFTRFGNCLDLCALAVPNGFTAARLPTSLQITCRSYDEATALRIGWAYQNATDWHTQVPPIGG
jgi:aspartyl-tRNA(Asn)/glutamyl-tRNA(Gln) amidotransferase subunit A